MNYQVATSLAQSDDILVVTVVDECTIIAPELFPAALCEELQAIIQKHSLKLKLGHTKTLYRSAPTAAQIILVGLGEGAKVNLMAWQKAAKAVGQALIETNGCSVTWVLDALTHDAKWTQAVVIALEDAYFQQGQLKQTPPPSLVWPQRLTFVGTLIESATAFKQGQAVAKGIRLTKTLGDLPANHCTPCLLAERALELAQHSAGRLTVEVLDETEIKALGMGCLLAVAQGSAEPPRFIVFKYSGGVEHQAPIVLVGKGVTFDSGGISLKQPGRMDEMKYDMCGAASVFGVMQALVELQAPVHVCGLIAATENMPGGNAVKPGDVVTSMAGLTVEVLNTDAEGRLILADALTYAERFKPKAVVNMATLTGAMIIALGAGASGLMANNQDLANALIAAGEVTNDRLWQFPIWDEYQELIDTPFADVANLGNDEAKSITAGCFLARFAKAYAWAHLDIAGTAWVGAGKRRWATGRPVATLVEYVLNHA